MTCIPCVRELHDECTIQPCCCNSEDKQKAIIKDAVNSWGFDGEDEEDEEKSSNSERARPPGRPRKNDTEIGTSAGRKRAAEEYKLHRSKPCEWRWLANCGGGKHPIIGCLTGTRTHRHHGPVKNTARNEETNVHLICEGCHNRWHTANDPDYDEEANELLPHSPTPMTPEDMLKAK